MQDIDGESEPLLFRSSSDDRAFDLLRIRDPTQAERTRPEPGRGNTFLRLPLVDDSLIRGADALRELRLRYAEVSSELADLSRVIWWSGNYWRCTSQLSRGRAVAIA